MANDIEKIREDQVMKSQGYAIRIEHILRRIFDNCDSDGFLGMIRSGQARKHPFLTLLYGYAYLYSNVSEETKKKMFAFSEKYCVYEDLRIDDMLSFVTNTEVINGMEYQIEYENGIEFVEKMIEDFEDSIA